MAVAAGARFVVSRDNDLLDLMTGTAPDATTFRAAHPYVTILDPPTFLRLLRPPPPPAAPATPNDRPDDEAP